MADCRFQNVIISALDVCTGPVSRHIDEDLALYAKDPGQLERLKKTVGVETRHFAPVGITTLDLCELSARRLLAGVNIDSATLDAVVFVTQTPDYFQPCNACLLHGRLGMGKHTIAFDINQGCSGWVYGLFVASSLIQGGNCRRVMLLAGDTVTQTIHPKDRSVVPLFGDAGSATLVEWVDGSQPSWFSLHTDGKGWSSICIPAGAARHPKSDETRVEREDADGSIRSSENLVMNGIEVFNFTLREEPKAVRELLQFASMSMEEIDLFVFHQANPFIIENIARRLKLSLDKVPTSTCRRYGNQSSASIPAAIADEVWKRHDADSRRLLCSGFGVGLSWASCIFDLGLLRHCCISQFGKGD